MMLQIKKLNVVGQSDQIQWACLRT